MAASSMMLGRAFARGSMGRQGKRAKRIAAAGAVAAVWFTSLAYAEDGWTNVTSGTTCVARVQKDGHELALICGQKKDCLIAYIVPKERLAPALSGQERAFVG